MRIVIVGLGSIGRRHLANIRRLEPNARMIAWRRFPAAVPSDGLERTVCTLRDVLDFKPDLALICGPATTHVRVARQLARRGVHLFIEKPVSSDLCGVDDLIKECRRRSLTLMVGYNLRFHAPLIAMKRAVSAGRIGRILSMRAEVGQYLPDWRPGQDYRDGVSGSRRLGGGVLLELSHELDLARWLVGDVSAVHARIDRLGDLDISAEDNAEILLRFRNGAVGSVHLDMNQRAAVRTFHIAGTQGTVAWDGENDRVRIYTARAGRWSNLHPARRVDRNAMYIAEARHLLSCVRSGRPARVDGTDGRRVLEIVMGARKASSSRPMVKI